MQAPASDPHAIVTEVYDLLSDITTPNLITTANGAAPFRRANGKILLSKPASIGRLREVRFRSFQPVMKSTLSNITRQRITVTVTPMIMPVNTSTKTMINSKFVGYSLYNSANGYDIPFQDDYYYVDFTGNMSEILTNINEKVTAYGSNFKPSGTFVFSNGTKRYTLAADTRAVWSIRDYYNRYHTIGVGDAVNPQFSFASLHLENPLANIEDYVFYTNNLMFRLINLEDDQDTTTIFLTFVINVEIDVDIINVSLFRQLNNMIEYLLVDKGGELAKNVTDQRMYSTHNQCVSTNNNLKDNLIFANYLYNGVDLVLRSSDIKNLSQIVCVSRTTPTVYMKSFEVLPTTQHVCVYLTDMKGQPIDEDYLVQLYSCILVEVDYVYDVW